MTSDLARAIVASLDDDALDQLAGLLAPRLAGTTCGVVALNVEQAATAANVSSRTIRRALTAGLLQGRQVAGRWQTTSDDLGEWQAAGGPTTPGARPRSAGVARTRAQRGRSGADAILDAGRVDW